MSDKVTHIRAHGREENNGLCVTVVPLPDGSHAYVWDDMEDYVDERGEARKRMKPDITKRHSDVALADYATRKNLKQSLREKAKANPKAAVDLADILALLGEGD